MELNIAFNQDGDAINLMLPDGRKVLICWNDIDDDALPQLEIVLPAPMVANCWMDDMSPGRLLPDSANAVESTQICIPIERKPIPPIESVTTAEAARDLAVEWQRSLDRGPSPSLDEVSRRQEFFTTLAERFELMDEFKENGIC